MAYLNALDVRGGAAESESDFTALQLATDNALRHLASQPQIRFIRALMFSLFLC